MKYSTYNEGKCVIAERFIRTLKRKIYRYMASVSKMCILINQMTQFINIPIRIIAQIK